MKTEFTASSLLLLALLLLSGSSASVAGSPATAPYSWKMGPATINAGTEGDEPISNVIIDLEYDLNALWVASGNGLGRFTPAIVQSDPADGSWLNVYASDGFGSGGVSGLAAKSIDGIGEVVSAATATDTLIDGETYSVGGGVGISLDRGETWTWMPQPVDDVDETEYEPTTTAILNVAYDIAIQQTKVWIAAFGGGLRYYDLANSDDGWIVRPPDDLAFDAAAYRNHLAVSVAANDSVLWVGSSGGINLSRDGGETWQRYTFSASDTSTISGNWVTAIGLQNTSTGINAVWAVTRNTDLNGEYAGVSVSFNEGLTWKRVLGSAEDPIVAHNFAFDDSVVYVPTDDGLYKSMDYGQTWGLYGAVYDPTTGDRTYLPYVYAAAHNGNTLYAGGNEGLAVTNDEGLNWRLLRTQVSVTEPGAEETYAYPNPFSPSRHGVIRMRYSLPTSSNVTVEIYDFAMELLIRPVKDELHSAGEHNAVWDGLGPGGRQIANGVYFYRILADGVDAWNKILVMD